MALLGSFWDRVAGNTLTGFTVTTFAHSLAAAPDLQYVQVKSAASGTAISPICALGANSSLTTVLAPSVLGAGVALFDLYNVVLHSLIK